MTPPPSQLQLLANEEKGKKKAKKPTMAASLHQAAKIALSSFEQIRTSEGGDIAQDVYRALRDEASLLLERQVVCDALDTDPFELTKVTSEEKGDCDGGGPGDIVEKNGDDGIGNGGSTGIEMVAEDMENELLEKEKNRELVARAKEMLRVISCTRTSTIDGYSSIHCIVQFDNDGKMQGVKDYIRLHFSFLREPQHDGGAGASDDDEVIYADADKYFFSDEEDSSDECNYNPNMENGNSEGKLGQPSKKRKRKANGDTFPSGKEDTKDEFIPGSITSDDENNQINNRFTPKTIVTYKVSYSVDSGKIETLLGVDIYALGDGPSIEEAIPIVNDADDTEGDRVMNGGDDDDDEIEGDSGSNHSFVDTQLAKEGADTKQSSTSNADFDEIVMSDDGSSYSSSKTNDDTGKGDRFGVSVDPENVVAFLHRANMDLNEQTAFYFLLTFPFYEHEWDIPGFLLSVLFDDEDEEEGIVPG